MEEVPKVPCLVRGKGRNWGLRRRVPDDLRTPPTDRASIPEPLRDVIGKREVWRSYGPVSHAEARRRHHSEMAQLDALFAQARRWLKAQAAGQTVQPVARHLAIPTEDDVRAVVSRWLYERERQRVAEPLHDNADAVIANLNTEEAGVAHDEQGWMEAEPLFRRLLADAGFADPPEGVRNLGVEMLRAAWIESIQRDRDRYEGRLGVRSHNPAFAAITAFAPPPPAPARPPITFGELCDQYLAAPVRAGVSPKTRLKYAGMIRVLKEILGATTPTAAIDRAACRRVQDVLLALPANAAQRYPGLKAPEVAERAKRDGLAPMHPNSVANHLDLLAAVFRYGRDEGLIENNPAQGLRVTTAKGVAGSEREARRPFTTAELTAIFSAPLYTGCQDDGAGYATPGPNRPRRGRFWVPLLGLWAGLRLNEACQLHVTDVAEEGGIPLILVRADGGAGKRVKTRAGVRRVPVHPELQRIGFLDYAAAMKQAGEERLFPDLRRGALGNYSDPFSKWFARFLEKAGVTSPGAVFHSFRHGFRDRLREAEVPKEVADALGGWATPGVGAAYGKGFSARMLAEHLGRISYPGLDLSHLARGD